MKTYDSYQILRKPSWAPPARVFGPVWTVLYILIAISYGYVGFLYFADKIPFALVFPFVLNIIFNLAFTPIQFGLRNNFLAMIDVLLVLVTLAWALLVVYPYVPWVSLLNIPYLLWTCFATVLQVTVTYLNRK